MADSPQHDERGSAQVARILYKEIVAGDVLKIKAESNVSQTGGGARDFRFGSYKDLVPAIGKMFPGKATETRKRKGTRVSINVFAGTFYWQDKVSGTVRSKHSYFEPPTDARPREGRIVRVHEYPCFDPALMPSGGDGNRVLLLLVQRSDDSVWPHYAEEASIRRPGEWDQTVAKELIRCLDAYRPSNRAVIGYFDFTKGTGYCNGR